MPQQQSSSNDDVEAREDTPLTGASPLTPRKWLGQLAKSYSWRLLTAVFVLNHLLKGFVAGGGDDNFIGKPAEFILASFGVVAGRLQVLRSIATSPWALKPVLGFLSDVIPIGGYHKMPYVVITSILAVCAALTLGFNLVSRWILPTVVALFLCFLQVSTADLMVESKASERVKEGAGLALGPDFFTFVWVGINVGQIVGIICVGFVIQTLGPHAAYLIAAPFMALVLWPSLANYLGEERKDHCLDTDKVTNHPILVALTMFVGIVVIILLIGGFLLAETTLFILSIFVCFMILCAVGGFLRMEISKPLIFWFILGVSTLNIDGAMFYFYTASPESYPEGPHLSPFFYATGIGAASTIGVFVGFTSSTSIFRTWKYTSIIFLTVFLKACARLLLIPVMLRWTRRLGPELDLLWILVSVFLDAMFSAWCWIPGQVMGAHLTPVGVEAMLQGLTAGIRNLANTLGSFCGAYLLAFFHIRPSGKIADSAMFDNLWKAQLLSCILPIAALALVPALVPDKTQTEPLITEETSCAVYSSPFQRLQTNAASSRESTQA